MFLTPLEICALTGRKTRPAQVLQLRYMGIEHRVRADGSVVVLKSHVDKVLGGIAEVPMKRKRIEPNLGAIC